MAFSARKATRQKAKARVALDGPSGSGKTYSALLLAQGLGDRIAIIDTEHSSADLYSDLCEYDVIPFDPPYSPDRYVEAIQYAEGEGYDVIIVDSITHEWNGEGGCLDIQTKLGGRFQDWAKVTPRHQRFIDGILRCKAHILVTCRTKTAYEVDEKSRKVTKVGTAPQQREGLDYEMTTVFNLTQQHMAVATKDRTRLFDGREQVITVDTGKQLAEWLNGGAEPVPAPAEVPSKAAVSAAAKRAVDVLGKDRAIEVLEAACGVTKTADLTEDQYKLAINAWREAAE